LQQFKKNVFSENEVGEKIKVYRSLSDADEANFVSNIFELHNTQQRKFSDFAILYRTNSQTRAFEDALRKKNIPYRVYGGLSFYRRKQRYPAYLRFWTNENDSEALSESSIICKRHWRNNSKQLLFLQMPSQCPITGFDNLPFMQPQLGLTPIITKLGDFWAMIKAFQVMLKTENVYDVAMEGQTKRFD
jgi:DNA helicase-2/ATP-dependent DNA helicase PcrA